MAAKHDNLSALRTFLYIFGIISLILFGGLFLLTAINSPLMLEGGALRFMRWTPLAPHIEMMLTGVYIVWGVFLLLAARNPLRYLSFLDFTLWANLVHGLLMVVQALMLPGYYYKLFTDVAYCLVLAIGLAILRPRRDADAARLSTG